MRSPHVAPEGTSPSTTCPDRPQASTVSSARGPRARCGPRACARNAGEPATRPARDRGSSAIVARRNAHARRGRRRVGARLGERPVGGTELAGHRRRSVRRPGGRGAAGGHDRVAQGCADSPSRTERRPHLRARRVATHALGRCHDRDRGEYRPRGSTGAARAKQGVSTPRFPSAFSGFFGAARVERRIRQGPAPDRPGLARRGAWSS